LKHLDKAEVRKHFKKHKHLKKDHIIKEEGCCNPRAKHTYERHSGLPGDTSKEVRKEGHGIGNWGNPLEEARHLTGIKAEEAAERQIDWPSASRDNLEEATEIESGAKDVPYFVKEDKSITLEEY